MLDLITLISANGLSGDLNICRDSEEYKARGNIFNDEVEETVQTPVEHIASEPGVIDTGLDMLSSFVSRVLSGLPDLNSVDLSMDKVKGKGQ